MKLNRNIKNDKLKLLIIISYLSWLKINKVHSHIQSIIIKIIVFIITWLQSFLYIVIEGSVCANFSMKVNLTYLYKFIN